MARLAAFLTLTVFTVAAFACNREDGADGQRPTPAAEPAAGKTAPAPTPRREALAWETDEKAALARASQNGRRVLLDVGAAWCMPCKEFEDITFADKRVIDRLADWVLLRFDVTDLTDADRALMSRYQAESLPAVIVLAPDGREELRITSFLPPDEFLARLSSLPALASTPE